MSLHPPVAMVLSAIVVISALAKLRGEPKVVKSIHDVTGVAMKWFPWLAACELAGAAGLLAGLLWPPIGIAASAGLIVYFVGAVAAHVRVGDYSGLGPASFVLTLAVAALATRLAGL